MFCNVYCCYMMEKKSEIDRKKTAYPAVYLVAAFFDINLALSALSSDNLLTTNPSPLHSEHIPEPSQSSHVLVGACLPRKFTAKRKWRKCKSLNLFVLATNFLILIGVTYSLMYFSFQHSMFLHFSFWALPGNKKFSLCLR